jgi:hypothetical protein
MNMPPLFTVELPLPLTKNRSPPKKKKKMDSRPDRPGQWRAPHVGVFVFFFYAPPVIAWKGDVAVRLSVVPHLAAGALLRAKAFGVRSCTSQAVTTRGCEKNQQHGKLGFSAPFPRQAL